MDSCKLSGGGALRVLLAVTAATVFAGAAWMWWADLPLAAALPMAVLAAAASQGLGQWAARAGEFAALAWAFWRAQPPLRERSTQIAYADLQRGQRLGGGG